MPPFLIRIIEVSLKIQDEDCLRGGNQGPLVCFYYFYISQAKRLGYNRNSFFPSLLEKSDPLERFNALQSCLRIDLNRWILITIAKKMASVFWMPCLCAAGNQLLWLPSIEIFNSWISMKWVLWYDFIGYRAYGSHKKGIMIYASTFQWLTCEA